MMSWRAPHRAAVIGVLALSIATGWWSRLPGLNTGGDDATYVSLSESLRHGRYNDEFLLGTPPHGKYPPGMPAWIAVIHGIAGPDLDAVRVGNLLLLALTAVLLGDGVRRLGGAWLGVGAVAVTAFNPTLLRLAIQIYSEIPYLALATAAVWATLVADQDPRRRWAVLAAVAALAGFLTRSIGVALVPGVLAWALLRRRRSAAVLFAVASILILGGWFAWTAHVGAVSSGLTYAEDIRSLGGRSGSPVATLLHRSWDNLYGYGTRVSLLALGVPLSAGTILDNIGWLLVLIPAGAAGFVILARRWPAAAATLAVTGGILIIWNDQNDRLLSPVIPSALAAILLGWSALVERILPRAGRVGGAILPLVLAGAGFGSYVMHDHWHRCDRQDPYRDAGCFEARGRELVAASRVVRDSLANGVVVATSEPATVAWFSGHQTMGIRQLLRMESAAEPEPQPATALLLSRIAASANQRQLEFSIRHCDQMAVRAAISPTTLLLTMGAPGPGAPSACDALAAFAREPAIDAH